MSKHFALDPDTAEEDWAAARKLARVLHGDLHDVTCGGYETRYHPDDYSDCVADRDCTCRGHLKPKEEP